MPLLYIGPGGAKMMGVVNKLLIPPEVHDDDDAFDVLMCNSQNP